MIEPDHAGTWWDAAAIGAPALRQIDALLVALTRAGVEGPWSEARDALDALRRLHGLGRPVCAGDEAGPMSITVQLDPMRSAPR